MTEDQQESLAGLLSLVVLVLVVISLVGGFHHALMMVGVISK